MGRFSEAETLLKQSLAADEKIFGPNDSKTAIALTNLANNYRDQHRAEDAIALQKRALSIDEKVFGADNPNVARSLGNLANSYADLNDYQQAAALLERVISIFTKQFGPDSAQSATALLNAGDIAQKLGQADKSDEYIMRALKINEKTWGSDHPALISELRDLAYSDIRRNSFDDARVKLDRALAIARSKLGDSHRRTIFTLVDLAYLAQRQGDWSTALCYLRNAAGSASHTAAGAVDESDLSVIYKPAVQAVWNVAQTQKDAEPQLRNEAYSFAQKLHESQAGAALAQMAARFGSGNNAMAAEIRRKQDLQSEIAGLDKRLTSELGMPDGKRNETLIASLRDEIAKKQHILNSISSELQDRFPQYAELADPAPLSIAQTQALLKPDEVLVSYVSLYQQSLVFAVTREGSAWVQIPLSEAELSARVAKLRKGLWNDTPGGSTPPFDLAASHELYEALLGPVEPMLANKTRLIVVPTGALTSLPFQVLVTKAPDPALSQNSGYRQAAWLIKDKAISVLPSITSLRALRSFAKASRATKPFIGFGDPVLDRKGSGKRTAQAGVQPYRSYFRGTAVNAEALRQGLTPLPETAGELRAVAHVLGAPEKDVRLGEDATLAEVSSSGLDQYRIIDFATHGLVAGEIDGLSEPALVLTLPEHSAPDDDGLLTASRVAKLSLDADWAVLSACNTAAGEKPGAEGLSGLARAFFYAGARALLVSHWPVDSDAAVKLTTRAFAELGHDPSIGRAEALRRSMLALIGDQSADDNADPSIWAPFALIGEGE
jgi:CHAT domain-containing protein/Tfp pilus assembly protein PilF